jgi:hypothetical protein
MGTGSTGLGFQTHPHAAPDLVKKQFPARGNCGRMQTMTIQQSIQVGAAVITIVGVYLMYKFGNVGAPGGYINAALVEQFRREATHRLLWQRVGLALSIIGIVLSCASAFAS